MFKLLNASRQVLRASLREREKGRGLASQPAPPHFLFRCLLEDEQPHLQQQHGSRVAPVQHQSNHYQLSHLLPLHSLETKDGWWGDQQHSEGGKKEGRRFPVHLTLLEVLRYGAVVSLALHLLHDRNNIDWCVLNRVIFGVEQVGRPISSANCPVVTLRQNRTALAQPKKTSLEAGQLFFEDEAVLLLQKTSLTDKNTNQKEAIFEECLPEVKSKSPEEEKSVLCREWIGDQDTSDYSSQSSLEEGEVFPFGLTLEEKALLKLEEVVAPGEFEAAEAVAAVRRGEGISKLEEVARRGSATGQFYLGMAYQHGLRISELVLAPHLDKALDLYRAAARQNHPEAQYNLAVMLFERDSESEEAYLLLQKAAKKGVVEAQEVLLVDECGDTKEVEKRSDNVDKMLGEVEDGGEQLYQWGREWEREAAKSMGEEWIQALPLFEKAASLGHRRAAERFRKLSKRFGTSLY